MKGANVSPTEYQKLCERTECDQHAALSRIATPGALAPVRSLHAVVGLTGEVGELAAAVERWLYYGRALDATNVEEELGDLLWYSAELCNALGLDLSTVMAKNIAKLKTRYPDKYEQARAFEEGRDRVAERKTLEGK